MHGFDSRCLCRRWHATSPSKAGSKDMEVGIRGDGGAAAGVLGGTKGGSRARNVWLGKAEK